jgi:subtilisin family serine protease
MKLNALGYFLLAFLLSGSMLFAQSVSLNSWNVMLVKGASLDDLNKELNLSPECDLNTSSITEEFGIYRLSSPCLSRDLLLNTKAVLYVESDIVLELRETRPNDELYVDQWQMELIEAPKMWDLSAGGSTIQNDEIVVALIDEGYGVNHPDLKENLWTNPGEIPDDNIDNDNNGYVDDFYGFHFEDSTDTHTNDALSHATAVAGIMGAKGDNEIGVAGVNWNLKILMIEKKV